MFWFIILSVWFLLGMLGYCVLIFTSKVMNHSWSNGDRVVGIMWIFSGPVFLILSIVFLILEISDCKHNEWWNEESKW